MEQHREKFQILQKLLIEENQKYNLTRITDPQEIQVRHFQDSLIVTDILKEYQQTVDYQPELVDIGSGAGFPSLALAIVFENWKFTSIEATGKKARFQEMAAEKLGLKNFKVLNGRAEKYAHDKMFRGKFDIATARAVGHLALITELASGFLKETGIILAWKGPKVTHEIELTKNMLPNLGMNLPGEIPYHLGEGLTKLSECKIIKLTKTAETMVEYPREFGVIKKSLD